MTLLGFFRVPETTTAEDSSLRQVRLQSGAGTYWSTYCLVRFTPAADTRAPAMTDWPSAVVKKTLYSPSSCDCRTQPVSPDAAGKLLITFSPPWSTGDR